MSNKSHHAHNCRSLSRQTSGNPPIDYRTMLPLPKSGDFGYGRIGFGHGLLALLLLLLASGCGDQVYSDYGHRRGVTATSLNGTRVLGQMFADAGHRVRSWSYLSPSLDRADVIVWFPDDFDAPTSEVESWLTYWLTEGDPSDPPRVLVYVGRDYDAAPDYWQRMQGQAPPGLKKEYARRLTEANNHAAARQPLKLNRYETDDWFTLDIGPPTAKVKSVTGPWATNIDSSKIDIVRNARLVPIGDDFEMLMADENGEPIASEFSYVDYDDTTPLGRLIMIENGSWLLNAPLVNHEHRKLAGELVASVGPPGKRVVFLESYEGGPPIRETDPNAEPPTGLQLFRVWPIGAVLTQLAALGIVFALMKWPIFGIPRRLVRKSTTDFASHIAALGRLLRDGRSRAYATELLALYRQSLHRDSGPVTTISQSSPSLPPPPPSTKLSE